MARLVGFALTLIAPSARWEASRPIAPATDSPITMHQIPAEAPPLCTAVTIGHNRKAVGRSRAQCRANVMLSALRKKCRFQSFCAANVFRVV
jgi:hypothetical protein